MPLIDNLLQNIDQHKISITKISSDITLLNNKLLQNTIDNELLQLKIDSIGNRQDELDERITTNENVINERLEFLLNEIDMKLVKIDENHFATLNRQIKFILFDILGYTATVDDSEVNNENIKNWIKSIFVAKEYLEERLNELKTKLHKNLLYEIELSSGIIMKEISNRIKSEVLIVINKNNEEILSATAAETAFGDVNSKTKISENNENFNDIKINQLNELDVKRIVREAIDLYDADKTGLVDYALESAGAEILSIRCTENYQIKTAQLIIFGIPLWYRANTPRTVITPSVQPGECWAFLGFPGFLVIKLTGRIFVTGFTLEHIPKSLSPTGHIDSAPRLFSVWGLNTENDQDPVLLGKYEYTATGSSLQYFAVSEDDKMNNHSAYGIVELRIESNHGNQNYTCLYRFRVHGIQASLSKIH